ncbi:MAG: hypothetical protein K2X82_02045 [Gemmataceae bacterium]|nr:hypothetical protein [Gemmataceae bacterium]
MATDLTLTPTPHTLDLTGLPEPFVRQVEQLVRQERAKHGPPPGTNGSPAAPGRHDEPADADGQSSDPLGYATFPVEKTVRATFAYAGELQPMPVPDLDD